MEDWGRRQLAYTVQKSTKRIMFLMNIECSDAIIAELRNNFRFNDAVLRSLILRRKRAITDPSPLLKKEDDVDDFGEPLY